MSMTSVEYNAMNAICDIAKIKKNDPDYWTRLEHQYAGMAMQGILSNQNIGADVAYMVSLAAEVAHALVEKMKEERK